MKTLTLSIKRKWFDEILAGTKKVETREIRPNIASRYIYYQNEETGACYDRDVDIPDDEIEKCGAVPVQYDAIKLLTGAYNIKPRPYIVVECKGADIVLLTDENDEPIAYDYEGRSYFMAEIDYHLGDIIEDKSNI